MFSEIVFQYKLPSAYFGSYFLQRTPGKLCLCHGSPYFIAGCITFVKFSLLKILLFWWYKQPLSSMACASLRRFFHSCLNHSGSTQKKSRILCPSIYSPLQNYHNQIIFQLHMYSTLLYLFLFTGYLLAHNYELFYS